MSKRQAPDTLPADFFSRKVTAPDTLPADFFSKPQQEDVSVKLDFPGPDLRTPQQVMIDQMDAVPRGIKNFVTGLPAAGLAMAKTFGKFQGGHPLDALQDVAGMAKGAVQPFVTTARNAGALAFPNQINAATPEENIQAGEGAGANLAGILMSEAAPAVGRGLKAGAKAGARAAGYTSEALQDMANVNKARALSPTTLQGRADAAAIAEEISKTRKAGGIRGKTIDRNIIEDLQSTGERVKKVEARLTEETRPEFQTSKSQILNEIDKAKSKLNIPRTSVSARPEAVTQLNEIRGLIDQMPDFIDFDQLIELRRQLDARAEEAGAFGVNADTLKADLNRGVADVVRGKLNGLDPELKAANHDFSISRKAADMVQRRQLGETGKIGSGLPGRGAILDDILSTWAGHAMGGPVGGAVAEGINLVRQSRGAANLKSAMQQKLSDFMREPAPVPKGLLGTGAPQLPTAGTSRVSGSPAMPEPGTREMRTGRLLTSGIQLPEQAPWSEMTVVTGEPLTGKGVDHLTAAMGPEDRPFAVVNGKAVPKIPKSGPARGMTLSHIDPSANPGGSPVYVYVEQDTGRQLRFTSPQK